MSQTESVSQLFDTAQNAYLKREQNSANDKLLQHMMTKGTHRDKITALAKQLQTPTPLKSLQTLIGLSEYQRNRKQAIMVITSLTEFFNNSLGKSQKYQHFSQSIAKSKLNKKKGLITDVLIQYYLDHKFKSLYQTFLKNLQDLLTSDLWFVKSAGLSSLCQLVRFQEMRSTILSTLLNKFGDKDQRTIRLLTDQLRKFSMHEFKCIEDILHQTDATIFRKNVSEDCQFYCLNFLNNLNIKIMHETQLTTLFKLYFKIFTKCTLKESETDLSSRLFLNTIKGLNKLFPVVKGEFTEFSKVFEQKTDFIYKTIHTTTNTKIKIQLFLFLYQTLGYLNKSLPDRYYNSLYSFLNETQLLDSSLLELFFDLLLISIKQDENLPRIQSFVKRLLQLCCEAQPQFIITSLILLSKVQEKVEPLLKKKEGYLVEDQQTYQHYDIFKRDPKYSKAENSCLWQLMPFLSHYHPTVRKFTQLILKSQPVQYPSNPLLDFSLANFVEKTCLKSQKKSQGWKVKNHKLINQMRPSKYDTLINKPLDQLGLDEQFFRKYLEKKSQAKRGKKKARDIQQYADDIVQKEIDRLQGKEIDEEDDISYGSYGDMEDEDGFDQEENAEEWDEGEGQEEMEEEEQGEDDGFGEDQEQFEDQYDAFGDEGDNDQSMQQQQSLQQKGFNQMFQEINKDEDFYRSKKKKNLKDKLQSKNKNKSKPAPKKQQKQGNSSAPKTKKIKKPNRNKKF